MAVNFKFFEVEDDPDEISSLIGLTANAERRVTKSLLKQIVQSQLAIAGQPETPPDNDCNDIAEHGIYRTDSSTTNGPGAGRLVLHLEYTAESRAAQVAFSAAASSLLDVQWREKYGSGSWSSWTQILTEENVQSDALDDTDGRLLTPGAFGLGAETELIGDWDTHEKNAPSNMYWHNSSSTSNTPWEDWMALLALRRTNDRVGFLGLKTSAIGAQIGFYDGSTTVVETLWHTGNTTVDGSGFLLEASPIVRVHTDEISEPNKPVGATLTHDETGVYVLSGVPPLASEGWTVRTPEDVNGNKVVAIGAPEYDADAGTLTLRTHDLLWSEGRLVPGDPMDIPAGHFVMLRFHEEAEPEEPEA